MFPCSDYFQDGSFSSLRYTFLIHGLRFTIYSSYLSDSSCIRSSSLSFFPSYPLPSPSPPPFLKALLSSSVPSATPLPLRIIPATASARAATVSQAPSPQANVRISIHGAMSVSLPPLIFSHTGPPSTPYSTLFLPSTPSYCHSTMVFKSCWVPQGRKDWTKQRPRSKILRGSVDDMVTVDG